MSGHAVSRKGTPIPWYTYPCYDFLKNRDFSDRTVLEFGGGQSTLWWAGRAKSVVTFEDDPSWYSSLLSRVPENVDLYLVSSCHKEECIANVYDVLGSMRSSQFDIIVIDGFYREEMFEVSKTRLSDDGVIIFDNSAGYGLYEASKDGNFDRVDFFGHTACSMFLHCTSLFFKKTSFVFSPRWMIPEMKGED